MILSYHSLNIIFSHFLLSVKFTLSLLSFFFFPAQFYVKSCVDRIQNATFKNNFLYFLSWEDVGKGDFYYNFHGLV